MNSSFANMLESLKEKYMANDEFIRGTLKINCKQKEYIKNKIYKYAQKICNFKVIKNM